MATVELVEEVTHRRIMRITGGIRELEQLVLRNSRSSFPATLEQARHAGGVLVRSLRDRGFRSRPFLRDYVPPSRDETFHVQGAGDTDWLAEPLARSYREVPRRAMGGLLWLAQNGAPLSDVRVAKEIEAPKALPQASSQAAGLFSNPTTTPRTPAFARRVRVGDVMMDLATVFTSDPLLVARLGSTGAWMVIDQW